MALTIFDFNSSTPTTDSGTISRTVTATPITLAAFGLNVPENTRGVALTGSVGVTATLLSPELLFRIFRGSEIIYTTRVSLDVNLSPNATVAIHTVDINPPADYYPYRMTVENVAPIGTGAAITGPVTLSGTSIG